MLAPKRRNAPQWKMMMMIMMAATEHHFSVQCSVGRSARPVGRSHSWVKFKIPAKNEIQKIRENDGSYRVRHKSLNDF